MAKMSDTVRDARRLLRPLRDEIVSLVQALVRVDSVAIPPNGHETAAQRVLRAALKPYRLDVEMYDCGFLERARHPYVRRDRHYRGRHNLVARLAGRGGGRSLLLSGHIDTVPTRPNPWRESPWSGAIRGGRLHGRGSWDMKSGLAAQFAVAMALRKAGVRLKGDLLCESVIDEEFGGGGGTLAGRLRGDNADACAIAEGTNHEVVRATRGGYVFDVVCQAGDPMAYFSKEEVVSPAIPMGRLLGWIDGWVRSRKTVDRKKTYAHFPDPAPVQVLALESNRCDPDVPWSVPLEARVRVYFQFLPHENVPRWCARSRRRSARSAAPTPSSRLTPCASSRSSIRRSSATSCRPITPGPAASTEPPRASWATKPGSRLRSGPATRSSLSATSRSRRCSSVRAARGSHNANEYVEVPSVLRTAEVYLAAALEWCGTR